METQPKKWYRFLWNKYLIVSIAFVVWMLFFDENSYQLHKESSKQIEELEHTKDYYKNLLIKEKEELEELKNNPEIAEKIAREKYYMQKENEDVFVIEFDESPKSE